MEQHEEPKGSAYPRGRGYGQDYMRGGEVFGGYGYSHRAEYERPRGEERRVSGSADAAAPAGEEVPADDSEDASAGPARFPQDERAGGWEIPHDLEAIRGAERERAEAESGAGTGDERDGGARSGATLDGDAPVPQIEHTFGDTGGNRLHSRSYYVTQAQLQQRLYALKSEREREGGRRSETPDA